VLSDESHQVRASTAFSLGRIGGDRAVELLLTALNDSTDGVRGAAAYALSETGDRRAIEPLERLLQQEKSEPIRQEIEIALQQLKARASRKL
jgi:HEAT repeat protein